MKTTPKILADHDRHFAAQHGIPMDDAKYYREDVGICEVDEQRWQAAQSVERHTWFELCSQFSDDRSTDHLTLFNNYEALPSHCGAVLEIGCGPFTQSRTVLRGRTLNSLTLLDPLLSNYLSHPHCSYKDGTLYGTPVNLFALAGENLPPEMKFDTVICINVLEHVLNANVVLEKAINGLNNGGILVLGETCHDEYHPANEFNLAHPLMLKHAFFRNMTAQLEPLFLNDSNDHFYLIAQKTFP